MEKAIRIIRGQMLLCTRLSKQFEELREALRTDTSGRTVSTAVQKLEPLLAELSRWEKEQREFFSASKASSLAEYVQAQPVSEERDVALRLFQQLEDMQKELRETSADSSLLLERSKKFVDYHINVLSVTKAGNTYGREETAGGEQRGMQLFDRNV